MRILVTGGAGFIGSHLVEALVADGNEVRVLDDLSSGTRTNLAGCFGELEFIEDDVRDAGTAHRAAEGCQAIFHGAAVVSVTRSLEDPDLVESVNVGGTEMMLETARTCGVRRLVLASSCAVYGDPTALPVSEEAVPDPLSPYAASKLRAEELCRRFAASGLETLCLRFFNVYGPRQDPSSDYSGVIARFIDRALAGRPLIIFGDGSQTRDFVFVRDVVRASVLALTRPTLPGVGDEQSPPLNLRQPLHADGRPLNIGSGVRTSVNEIAATVGHLVAEQGRHNQSGEGGASMKSTPSVVQPVESGQVAVTTNIAVDHRPARVGDILHSQAETQRAHALLGFSVEMPFTQGLAETVAWYANSPAVA